MSNPRRPLNNAQFRREPRLGLNPYFSFHGQNFDNTNEQDLIRSMHQECIQIHGYRVIYIPRSLVKLDRLFGEDTLSKFEQSHQLAAWVENFEGYGPGGPDLLSKFGITQRDELTVRISAIEFVAVTGMKEPREGDLVYAPLNRDLLEVKWVEDEQQFYPLGQQMTWQLRLESFDHSMEPVTTGTDADSVNLLDVPSLLDDINPVTGGDNKVLQDEADPTIDWTENSPFGNY